MNLKSQSDENKRISKKCKELESVSMLNIAVFWDVISYILVDIHKSFQWNYCLHFQGRLL
jgi:hypothetical protein